MREVGRPTLASTTIPLEAPIRNPTQIGYQAFAFALLGFAVLHVAFADFVVGRAPAWPEGVPGASVWGYAGALLLTAAAFSMLTGTRARWTLVVLAGVLFAWAFVRHIPLVAESAVLGGTWTTMGKAMVLTGGTLTMVAASLREPVGGAAGRVLNEQTTFIYAGRVTLGLFMILCGIQHFIHVEFVASLVPGWLPGSVFWTYFGGIALMAGGLGLLIPHTAPLAAKLTAAMIFSWVLMIHIPRALAPQFDGRNEWTSVFEALALSALALVLSYVMPRPVAERDRAPMAGVA